MKTKLNTLVNENLTTHMKNRLIKTKYVPASMNDMGLWIKRFRFTVPFLKIQLSFSISNFKTL